jgi:hypothetical protein
MDETDRNRQLWKWDRNRNCGVEGCTEDHRSIDIGEADETELKTEETGSVAVHNSR